MIKSKYSHPDGVDPADGMIFAASLAGFACHQAVKEEDGKFSVTTAKSGKYYRGSAINKYLAQAITALSEQFRYMPNCPMKSCVISSIRLMTESKKKAGPCEISIRRSFTWKSKNSGKASTLSIHANAVKTRQITSYISLWFSSAFWTLH